tara:strand:+ start:1507 stop:1767 length:261 start_codon:yes stop_codon:yes gene_type:complete
MVNTRKFIISDELFSGFEMDIDLDRNESIIDIINTIKNELLSLLDDKNLSVLSQKLKVIDFHIHDHGFGDILLSDTDTIFFICSHC